MNRITYKHLEAIVDRINRMTNSPMTPWRTENGRNVANVGNYHLDSAYGGVRLVRMVSEGGGCRNITSGYDTKKDCAQLMHAFISGLEATK